MLMRSRRVLVPAFAFTLAFGLPPAAGAHHDPQAMRMDMAAMNQGSALGASAAFGAEGRLWLATVQDGHVLVRHSDDLGKHFSAPVDVNRTAEKIDAHGENRPEIAVAPDGTLYVTWAHPLAKHWTSEVRFARSTDDGKTFSTPLTISGDDPDGSRGFATLAVAGNGEPVVAWIDNGDVDAPKVPGQPHRATLAYSWSDDGGKAFAPPRRMPGDSCECCRIALAHEPDGKIAALYRSVYGDNIRDHAFAVLNADGKPESPARVTFSNWQVAACPEQGPGLAIGANGVRHAVWYEASHGPAIWYGHLPPGREPRDKMKIGGAGASHAEVAVHGQTVWIAWNQVDAKGYTLMLRTSRDGGDHFDAARALAHSAAAAYSPQLLVRDDHAFVAWNTAKGFRLIAAPSAKAATP